MAELSLPVEIWLKVFSFLQNVDLKSIGLVSRHFRGLAAPLFFTSVSIRLGRFPTSYDEIGINPQTFDEEKEEEAALGSLIQSFRVVLANAQHMMVFERKHVRLALRNMTKLRHFAWHGDRLPLDVAQEIAASRPTIESLHVHGLEYDCATALENLANLQDLQLIDANSSSAIEAGFSDGQPYSAFNNILISNQHSLKRLSLGGSTAWGNSASLLRVADSLTHLAISDAQDCPGLDLFLRRANSLESLTLLDVCSLACFANTPADKDILPYLRDLKLSIDHLPHEDELGIGTISPDMAALSESLRAFVGRHTGLRRFDFSLWPTQECSDVHPNGWFRVVVEAVHLLEGVSALGLSFPALEEAEQIELLEELCRGTPSLETCTALRLDGISDTSMEKVLERAQPAFLSLSNMRHKEYCEPTHGLPSLGELFSLSSMCDLEQVCLGGRLFDTELPNAAIWSEERVCFRTLEDFCCEDAYWLMSYRTIEKDYDPDYNELIPIAIM
ncbi:hypothetical protein DFH11DRAFT_497604 [Phellopilus nigrolimitatus]|nr:hypothetical protein DFH11DRAFT_497604 [Phellopilus nigrolimitatus]